MSAFRWELRRLDGRRIDRAHRLAWLRRAGQSSAHAAGLTKGYTYEIVHLPSGTVVGHYERGFIWAIDAELVRELEPAEAP